MHLSSVGFFVSKSNLWHVTEGAVLCLNTVLTAKAQSDEQCGPNKTVSATPISLCQPTCEDLDGSKCRASSNSAEQSTTGNVSSEPSHISLPTRRVLFRLHLYRGLRTQRNKMCAQRRMRLCHRRKIQGNRYVLLTSNVVVSRCRAPRSSADPNVDSKRRAQFQPAQALL